MQPNGIETWLVAPMDGRGWLTWKGWGLWALIRLGTAQSSHSLDLLVVGTSAGGAVCMGHHRHPRITRWPGGSLNGAVLTILSCLGCCRCSCWCPNSWGQERGTLSHLPHTDCSGESAHRDSHGDSHLPPQGHLRLREPNQAHRRHQAQDLGHHRPRAAPLHLEGSRAVRAPPRAAGRHGVL